ncbi:MAG: N2,N2-dimethylguanosine tRNA methyltransferase [Synechococcaceae cyanobacterium]|nr:N2,N2-dimethylguanosine tRNA methyltransferase [Synechococcaceae cyanobacterium]
MRTGAGFFRPDSRPARDFGVLLSRVLAAAGPVRLLDVMAGCGIRALRAAVEGHAAAVWANDADPDRLPLLEANLATVPAGVEGRFSAHTAQRLLADCLVERRRFELVDLDAFGSPTALLPLALEAVAFGGVLYLASTDGRSPTGHDRPAAVRRLGAAARAHPASWELALRLQLGTLARAAWAMGRGLEPLLSFSEGRTFRTAVRVRRQPAPGEEAQLGLLAHCHGCGDQQQQSLLRLGRWAPCACGGAEPPLAVSGPLWLGPLQYPPTLTAMLAEAERSPSTLAPTGRRLLGRLCEDPGDLARCWPIAAIGRALGHGPPPLERLVAALQAAGWRAGASGVMAGQLRCDAPWAQILATAAGLDAGDPAK